MGKCFQRNNAKFLIEPMERRLMLTGSATLPVQTTTDPTGVSSYLLSLAASGLMDPNLLYDSSGRVGVRVTANNVAAIEAPLAAIGFAQTSAFPADHFVDGYLPYSALANIQSLSGVGMLGVLPSYRPILSTGKVDSEGDSILEADRTRAATGVTGTGVTVGVLSDSYNNLGGAAADVASGDLPNNVNVIEDNNSSANGQGTDEGRAMLQIVHDIAPGASLAFATGDDSEGGYAQNIQNLANPVSAGGAGAKIIVDDLFYEDEPFFQDGVVAQAVNNVVNNDGVSYFSATGNDANQGYDSSSVNFISDTIPAVSSTPGLYYNYNPAGIASDENAVTLKSGNYLDLSLDWDQPYYSASGVTSTLNMYLVNTTTNQVVASSTDNNIADQTPNQVLFYQSRSSAATFDLVISLAAGTVPGRIKYVNFSNGDPQTFTYTAANTATIVGHAAAAGAMAVAAAPADNQRVIESYSSEGPSAILFDSNGNRLSAPQVRAKPDITATDGVSTTFFYGSNGYNGYPMFYGTSAAAPHAAAVAALVAAANPSWTPAQIDADLKATADSTISPANVNYTGAGLIDAYRAVVGAAVPVTTVNDGFESGYLGKDWTTYTSGAGRIEVSSANSPEAGTYQLVEDGITDNHAYPILDEAVLNLNVPTNVTNMVLVFYEKKFSGTNGANQTDYPMPASFTGHGDYDGVCFSVNGTTWYSLESLTGSNSTTSYQNNIIPISGIAAMDGVTLGGSIQIKFQHYDKESFTAPDGGIAIDGVAVSLMAAPILTTNPVSQTVFAGNTATFTAAASGVPTPSVQWQVSTDGGNTFNNITGATSPTLSFTTATSENNYQYQAILYNNLGAVTTTPATLNVTTLVTLSGGTYTANASGGVLTVNGPGGTATYSLSLITGIYTRDAAVTLTGDLGQSIDPGTIFLQTHSNDTTVTFIGSEHLGIVTDSGKIIMQASTGTKSVLSVTGLSIATTTGLLDLNNNDLIVHNTGSITPAQELTSLTASLKSGYANGAWNGSGIVSTSASNSPGHLTALGVAPITTAGTFDNQSVTTTDVVVKYTYYGDANLDGKVDGSDYSKIDNGFANRLTGWLNGDFNYDGVIDGSDYTLIDDAFNAQGARITASIAPATATVARIPAGTAVPLNIMAENPDPQTIQAAKKRLLLYTW